MTADTKTLRETVGEVIGEQIAKSNISNPSNQGGIVQSQSGETQSGGKPEFVAGVDISDIPEQDRPRIKAKLEEKLKLLDKGFQPKFQEVANLKKSLEWLSSKGLTPEKAEKILLDSLVHGDAKQIMGEKKEAVNTLDKLIQESPYEQKEALQNMRKIILEETSSDKLQKKIEELESRVSYLSGKDMNFGKQSVVNDLTALEGKFGKDMVDKYRDIVITEWEKYPNSKAKDILKYVVPDDEYEQALLSKVSRQTEKLNAVTNNGSGVTSSTASLNVRKTGLRDILTSVIKERKG
jgi:hypothetical protein